MPVFSKAGCNAGACHGYSLGKNGFKLSLRESQILAFAAEGIPRSFTISSNEILEALTEPLNSIVSAVKTALEQTPPELGADIAEKGMVLTGGGALLRDIDRLLMEETGLPVVVAEDPLTCVVRGSGKALEHIDRFTNIFTND